MSETVTSPEQTIGGYPVHPVASLFPLLEGEQYQELKASIQRDRQQEPIVITSPSEAHPKGQLLDGRNRLLICNELGIEPTIEPYTGTLSAEDYIFAKNLLRRHLTDDQRVMITTQVMLAKETAEAQARKQDAGNEHGRGRAKLAATSTQANRQATVTEKIAAIAQGTDYKARQAASVMKHAPALVELVKSRQIPLRQAARTASAIKPANVRDKKPQSVNRGQAPTGKRQHMLQNAAKGRMINALSYMTGMQRGLSHLDLAKATALMAPDEVDQWLAIAHGISQRARTFERKLREVAVLSASRGAQSGEFEEITATDSGGTP
jgi:ParB-like chromosome segregation protein Spo0J